MKRTIWLAIVTIVAGCATIEDQDELEAAAVRAGLDPRQCVLHNRGIEWLDDRFRGEAIATVRCEWVSWPSPTTPLIDRQKYEITVGELLEIMRMPFAGFNCMTLRQAIDGRIRQIVKDRARSPRHCDAADSVELPAELTDPDTVTPEEILMEILQTPTFVPGGSPLPKGFPAFCPHAGGCPDDPANPFEQQDPSEPVEGDG